MQRSAMWYLALLLGAPALPDATMVEADDPRHLAALDADAECSADGLHTCALNALQQRAKVHHDRTATSEAALTASSANDANRANATRLASNDTDAAVTHPASDDYYFDGRCHPCPAWPYRHCTRGGKLIGTRKCGFNNLYCEGKCSGVPTLAPPSSPGVMTLYHTTSPEIAHKILSTGFRPGRHGWCGAGIYFYGSPILPATKLGDDSHVGAVIEAVVDMGKMAHLNSKCFGYWDYRRYYDSVTFDPFDGAEYVIYTKDRIISTRLYAGPKNYAGPNKSAIPSHG